MPVQPTYPGVYVQEVSSGVKTITGVSTSIVVFIGRAKWGPVNEPFLCLNYSDFERAFTTDTSLGDMARAVRLFFLNGGMQCYIMRIATLLDLTPANNASRASITLHDAVAADSLIIRAKYHGDLGNSIRAVVDYGTPPAVDTFNLKLYRLVTNRFGAQVETDIQKWTGLSIDPDHPRFVEKYVDYKWAGIKLATGATQRPAVSPVGPPVVVSVLSGGADGIAPLSSDYDAAYLILDKEIDIFNLMILPKDIAFAMAGLWGNASVFCQKRRAFLLIDPPETWTTVQEATDLTTGVTVLRTGLVKDHSAVFYPRVSIRENGSTIHVGPGGAIAGLMARIDSNRGVWKAPAGVEADLRGINGLEYRFSDGENGVLPNDEPLWSQIRLNVGAFMHNLFIQGAFQGQNPKDAYFVKCNKETTTQNDINLGIVNIWVGFAPLKPAEFVILYLQQMAGNLNL
ncbi:MAG: hypothetical protein NTV01_06295 [Bacteroidia bacterium]|nr:hypothetical protein [Bacteroidia bacterium]